MFFFFGKPNLLNQNYLVNCTKNENKIKWDLKTLGVHVIYYVYKLKIWT